jgi:hypothetical protein
MVQDLDSRADSTEGQKLSAFVAYEILNVYREDQH